MLYVDLHKKSGLSIDTLLEYVLIEAQGKNVMSFIETSLGPFEVIEHF